MGPVRVTGESGVDTGGRVEGECVCGVCACACRFTCVITLGTQDPLSMRGWWSS